jgi:hypothetical protein
MGPQGQRTLFGRQMWLSCLQLPRFARASLLTSPRIRATGRAAIESPYFGGLSWPLGLRLRVAHFEPLGSVGPFAHTQDTSRFRVRASTVGDGSARIAPLQLLRTVRLRGEHVPVKVKKITTAKSIVGGDNGYCAILSSHGIDCWGLGEYGELGNGSESSSDVPVAVETITNGSKVVSGYLNYCALLATKGLDCWGYNGNGQLGDGTMTNSDTPVPVEAA